MKYIIWLLTMLLPILSGAQSLPVKALTVGDRVPDITITNVYNYPTSTIHLSDLKGKLIILDFWATWCGACLQKMSYLDSLQEKLSGKIQVLLINCKNTNDDQGKIERFINSRKSRENVFKLPAVIGDTIFNFLFPHIMIPHYVWIGGDGKVIGITDSHELTFNNITDILNGKKIVLREKKDISNFINTEPLFINGNGGEEENIIFRSILTGYSDGLPTEIGGGDANDTVSTRIFCTNATIILLYKLAYPNFKNFPNSRIKIESNDPGKYISTADNWDTWKLRNTYTYELIVPFKYRKRKVELMQNDLNRYFGLRISREKRRLHCWVITRLANNSREQNDSKSSANNFYDVNNSFKFVHNKHLFELVDYLNNILSIPVIDETEYRSKVNIDLPDGIPSFPQLRDILKRNGFDLKKEMRDVEVSIIREK